MKKTLGRFFKIISFFIVLIIALPTFATAVLNIVPSSTDEIDLDATFPTASLVYTVTNNTTQTAYNIYVNPNYQMNGSLVGTTLSSDTCSHQNLAPSGTCSFTVNMFSKGVTGVTAIGPQVCKSGGIICSVPVVANRVPIYTFDTAPVIRSVSPTFGAVSGGNTVVIKGFNFIAGTVVNFGGQTVTPTIVSTRRLDVVVPSVSGTGPQTVNVSVTTSEGGSNSKPYIYYSTPTISSLSSNYGQNTGGNTITISGTNFIAGDTTVSFGGTAGTNVSVSSSTSLSVTVPAHSMGAVSVTVTTSIGTSSGVTYTYYATPTVTGVSPTFGSTAGGTSVTITGTNFTSAATVNFGTTAATSVTFNSSTSLTAVSPAGTTGTVNITVTTLGGTSATSSADQFTYYGLPTITGSLSPNNGTVAGGNTVTISGTNFVPGNTSVSFGGTAGTDVSVSSATSLTVTAPAHAAGNVTVTVTTATIGTSNGVTYTYNPPIVTAVSPTFGTTAGGTVVQITGQNFTSGATVSFGSVAAASTTFNSSTSLTATSPAQSAGTVNITVTTAGQTSATSSADEFTYGAPITSAIYLNTNTPGVSGGAGTGTYYYVNNTGSSVSGISVDTTGTNLTVVNDGCSGSTGSGKSCLIRFTSSNVTTDASSGNQILLSGTGQSPILVPIGALNPMVMSPPYQDPSVSLLLVESCTIPQILEVVNNSNTTISGISATASAGLSGVTITNYCNNVTLAQNQICMIEIATNTATSGSSGTITIANTTNSQQIVLQTAVEAAKTSGSLPPVGSSVPSISSDVVFANQIYNSSGTAENCNVFETVASSNALNSPLPWAASTEYQGHTVPYPGTAQGATTGAQQLYQGQINTISVTAAEQTQSEANTAYASGDCVDYTETYTDGSVSTNWYLPSICELAGNNVSGSPTAGCLNSANYIGAAISLTTGYWGSTEQNSVGAWLDDFIFSPPAQVAQLKTASVPVRCSRAFTD